MCNDFANGHAIRIEFSSPVAYFCSTSITDTVDTVVDLKTQKHGIYGNSQFACLGITYTCKWYCSNVV